MDKYTRDLAIRHVIKNKDEIAWRSYGKRYSYYYCEDMIYMINDIVSGNITIVKASCPDEAIDLVRFT